MVKQEDDDYDSYDELLEEAEEEGSAPLTQAGGSQITALTACGLRPYRTVVVCLTLLLTVDIPSSSMSTYRAI
jgi:hypothetical protein